jgi:2-oxoglutarate ferredoxin oxidoreductase subunit gamma
MIHELLLAGFGGQGVMLMGQILVSAGMLEGKHVSWIPSYGAEMRGGTANCSVIVSDKKIGSPIVPQPGMLVAMNGPSLDKFEAVVRPGGTILVNSSLISRQPGRKDVKVYQIPANALAEELANSKVANMVMLGAIVAAGQPVQKESLSAAFKKMFEKKFAGNSQIFELNEQAIAKGFQCVK